MHENDIPAGLELVAAAGWNQTQADWKHFLIVHPEGCFVAESGGQVAGTATSIIYENRLAWVGMVLVRPDYRRRGIATQLLETVLRHLDSLRIPVIKLDATPQGAPLYEKLGFATELQIERWSLHRAPVKPAALGEPFITENQFEEVLTLDRDVFGADRQELLLSVHASAPYFTAAVGTGRNLAGYTLGRLGRIADHLGPWVAKDEQTASRLLKRFLAYSARECIVVDCVKSNPAISAILHSMGFEVSRPLLRMARGSGGSLGRPELLVAILGPEFG
ncbi:MAG: GNAT family N-acetyltransferase [Terriglobia bacterium]